MIFKENLNIPQLLLLSSHQDGNKYCQKEMQSNILSFNTSAVPLFYSFIAVGNGLLASSSFVLYTWLFFVSSVTAIHSYLSISFSCIWYKQKPVCKPEDVPSSFYSSKTPVNFGERIKSCLLASPV